MTAECTSSKGARRSAPARRRRLLYALLLAGIFACLSVSVALWWTGRQDGERRAQRALAMTELLERRLGSGYHGAVPLSPKFCALARGGTVDVVIDGTGRTVVLFKESIGWKGNFQGVLTSEQPFRDSDFAPDGIGRTMVRFPDFGYPIVVRRVSSCELEVMFDLG